MFYVSPLPSLHTPTNHTTISSPAHITWYLFRFHLLARFCSKLNEGRTDLVALYYDEIAIKLLVISFLLFDIEKL